MIKIGVFDSGVGGLSVLKELMAALPGAEFVYYADSANCPYGIKTREFICERALQISSDLVSQGVCAIVVACNTATANAISVLRERFDIPFVGMEPAVKPAALGTKTGTIGVLATEGTLHASRYLDMRQKFTADVKVVEHAGTNFVELVERGELSGERAIETVRTSLKPLLDAGADTIVLGCTHYPFLLPVLQQVAGPSVRFIDPAPAIARQLVRILGTLASQAMSGTPRVTLQSSSDPTTLKNLFETVKQ